MKRTVPAAILAMLFFLPATAPAQGDKPAAAKPVADKPAAQADAPRRSRAHEDARACLELPTNIEIHKCAEQYR